MHNIISKVYSIGGRDISVYADSFLNKVVLQRFKETSSINEDVYAKLLDSKPEEINHILDALNNSYSMFFRNPLDYSIIERFILPSLHSRKDKPGSSSIRIWSAGCADGSEPYTLAIIGNELMDRKIISNPPLIFATDISEDALGQARLGLYFPTSLQNVKHYQIESYFSRMGSHFKVDEQIKKSVEFSRYDLLDAKTSSPPSAIFGGFDMVVCCNIMVYYKKEIQGIILKKIHNSLNNKGFLMVDPSEKAIVKSFKGFKLYSALGNIFVKI
jgi:chemotaxis protein methyltransferase CheR